MLPCYWIYWEAGKAFLEVGSRTSLYQKWIDTHGGEEFGALVEAVLGLADNVHEDLNTAQKARVKGPSSPPAARSGCSGTRPGGWKGGQFKVSAVSFLPSDSCPIHTL